MRRREFITLLGGAAVTWPIKARAQRQSLPVVGHLDLPGNPQGRVQLFAAIRKGLNETGYVEGQNVGIDYLSAEGQIDRLPALASELVRRRVAVIITPGNRLAAQAAKAATATIPIVFSFGGDPVEVGLVASLNRPSGNITGFTEMAAEIAPKRLGIIHELLPTAGRFALLVDPAVPPPTALITGLHAAALSIGREIEVVYSAGTVDEIDKALASLVQKRIDAVLVNSSNRFYDLRLRFAILATRYALPAVYWDRAFPDAGGLMSYGSSVEDMFRQVGVYAGRILKGEKPADLPVQQPTKFELVVNFKTAKSLGLEVPPALLARADEVIE